MSFELANFRQEFIGNLVDTWTHYAFDGERGNGRILALDGNTVILQTEAGRIAVPARRLRF